ncbi:MAG: SDR family NAD(P)-dependent oxidoreductase [Planctomycetota bacterium]
MAARLDTLAITGASSGIGAAAARRLAPRCGRLVLIARRADRLRDLAESIRAQGLSGDILPLPADLTDPADRHAVAQHLADWAAQGRLALVNNAGTGQYRPTANVGADEHRRMMELNYFAAAELMHAAIPGMAHQGWGRIVNVASVAVQGPPWGHGIYTASKAALAALGATLDGEHRHQGVRVSTLYPGVIDTEFFHTPDYAPLWQRVKRHAIGPDRAARAIESLIDRPRIERTVPCHFRVMHWLRLIHAEWGHRAVMASSRPDTPPPAPPTTEPSTTSATAAGGAP